MEFVFQVAIWVAVIFVPALIVWNVFVGTVMVYEWQTVMLFRYGRFHEFFEPGYHMYFRPYTRVEVMDSRRQIVALTGQEIPSSDGVSVKVSMLTEYDILDPVKILTTYLDYTSAIHASVQIALREVVGQMTIDALMENREAVGTSLREKLDSRMDEIGVRLHMVNVRDIILPGELRTIFSQVIRARKEGLAVLERTRGETAAVRNLANAAKLIESNPGIMKLKLMQAISESDGNTFYVGLNDSLDITSNIAKN